METYTLVVIIICMILYISRDELYKALEDDNIPNDYDHSWTGYETSENQMENFGSNSSCSTTSSSEGTVKTTAMPFLQLLPTTSS